MTAYQASRRRVVAAVGAALGLSGCSASEDDDVPEPVDLSGGTFDFQGGMEIGRHGGPNGQIFYDGHEPDPPYETGNGDLPDSLAAFHTLVYGLFPYHFDRLDRGWEATVIYVTDYSAVEYDLPDGEPSPQMPSPTAPATFEDATELTYVAESDVRAGMGPGLFPFSDTDEATSFASSYDGRTVEFDDIDRQLIDALSSQSVGDDT